MDVSAEPIHTPHFPAGKRNRIESSKKHYSSREGIEVPCEGSEHVEICHCNKFLENGPKNLPPKWDGALGIPLKILRNGNSNRGAAAPTPTLILCTQILVFTENLQFQLFLPFPAAALNQGMKEPSPPPQPFSLLALKRTTEAAKDIYIKMGCRVENGEENPAGNLRWCWCCSGGKLCSKWAAPSVGPALIPSPRSLGMAVPQRKSGRSCFAEFSHTWGFFCLCFASWHLSRTFLSGCFANKRHSELLLPFVLSLPSSPG